MANPNPFLFDAPAAGGQVDNPFLDTGGAPNPFLMGTGAAQPQPMQVQYNAFGQPMPMQQPMHQAMPQVHAVASAANPFADFGAPAPQMPAVSSAAMFGVAPPQQQQFYAQPSAPAPAPAAATSPFNEPPPQLPTKSPAPVPEPVPVQEEPGSEKQPEIAPVDTSEKASREDPAPEPTHSSNAAENPFLAATQEVTPPPPVDANVEATADEVAAVKVVDDESPSPPPPPEKEENEQLTSPPPPEPEPMAVAEQAEPLPPALEKRKDSLPPAPKDVEPSPRPLEAEEEKKEQVVSPENEEPAGPSTGATLFDLPAEPDVKDPPEDGEAKEKPKMSTGDAIFADLPATDVKSTGANIFGTSEESAADTTGATLFGVQAPRAAQPALGAMSGWDDAFDRKFEDAESTAVPASSVLPGDPFDPFVGTGAGLMPGATAGGFGDASSFGAAPASAVMAATREQANPFLEEAKDDGDEDGDGPLFDDDTSRPLEPFPRVHEKPEGWEFFIRHPPKKKLTAQR